MTEPNNEYNYDGEVDYYTQEIRGYADKLYINRLHTIKNVDVETQQNIINRLKFALDEMCDIFGEAVP